MEKNPLNNIVKSLSKDEVRFFKLFLKRTNNKNRKDVQLFNFLRKISKNYQTNDALKVVDTNPNNLYQIRNRLYHEVNNSMIWQHIWKDEQSKSFSYVLLARVYRNKGELQLAYHFLQKAEREADSNNLYQLLSIIYSDIIDLSHELVSIDLDKYIALKRKNIKVISEIEEIDILLSKVMYDTMVKYGGIGLSANQVGLPFRMFVMGGHPEIDDGRVRAVFNPLINDVSQETSNMKEGCLSFPFLFLSINRPKWCSVKYTDENGKEVEEVMHGMNARVFQHENEHMNGYVFTDLVSKFKLERAEEARKKMMKKFAREGVIR